MEYRTHPWQACQPPKVRYSTIVFRFVAPMGYRRLNWPFTMDNIALVFHCWVSMGPPSSCLKSEAFKRDERSPDASSVISPVAQGSITEDRDVCCKTLRGIHKAQSTVHTQYLVSSQAPAHENGSIRTTQYQWLGIANMRHAVRICRTAPGKSSACRLPTTLVIFISSASGMARMRE